MSAPVCVSGTMVSLEPVVPTVVLTPPTSSIPSSSPPLFSVNNLPVLTETDITSWAPTLTCAYTNPPYVTPGALQGTSAEIIKPSLVLFSDEIPTVLQTTTAQVTLTVTTPAQYETPQGPQLDPVPTYVVTMTITNAEEVVLTSE